MIEKCKNPENKDCDNEAERTHRLVEKEDNEKDYPMCNECYESWCYDLNSPYAFCSNPD